MNIFSILQTCIYVVGATGICLVVIGIIIKTNKKNKLNDLPFSAGDTTKMPQSLLKTTKAQRTE